MDEVQRLALGGADAVGVLERRRQPMAQVDHDVDGRVDAATPAPVQDLLEVGAVHELHGDPVHALVHAEVVDLHDPGVVQGRRDARLVPEELRELLHAGVHREDLLEGDASLEPRRALEDREVDLGHAPPRDPSDQPVSLKRRLARSGRSLRAGFEHPPFRLPLRPAQGATKRCAR